MSKEIGKLIIQTYHLINFVQHEYHEIVLDIINEIKNDYYKNKLVLDNNNVQRTLKEHRGLTMIFVMINDVPFNCRIDKIDKFII